MSDDATRLNASLEERLALINSYPEFFICPPSMENIHIPPGWTPLVRLALRSAVDVRANFVIQQLYVRFGELTVNFAKTSVKQEEDFLSILSETKAYCSCCGVLLISTGNGEIL